MKRTHLQNNTTQNFNENELNKDFRAGQYNYYGKKPAMLNIKPEHLAFYGLMSIIAFISWGLGIWWIGNAQKEPEEVSIALQQAINQVYHDKPARCFSGDTTSSSIRETRELDAILQNNNARMSRKVSVVRGNENPISSEVPSVLEIKDEIKNPYDIEKSDIWKISRCYASKGEQKEYLDLVSRWERSTSWTRYISGSIMCFMGATTTIILVGSLIDSGDDTKHKFY